MTVFKKKINYYAAVCAFLILAVSGVFYYFLFTTKGSSYIVEMFFSRYFNSRKVEMKAVSGDFFKTLLFRDVVLEHLAAMPRNSKIKMQEFKIALTSLNPQGISFDIRNGRFMFSGGDIIFFYGKCRNGRLDIVLFSNAFDLAEISDLLPFRDLSGVIRDIDMRITGSFFEPGLAGRFEIEKISYKGFNASHCPCALDLKFKNIKDNPGVYGKISLAGGTVRGLKTALVNLKKSGINFSGDFKKPFLNLTGTAQIEDIKINIILQGSLEKPDFKLTSSPPMNQDRLLFMLVTNKAWKNIDAALSKGEISADAASDFLNYFIFSGPGSDLMQNLGVHDISIKYDNRLMGVGATKDITDKAQVSYFIEQQHLKDDSQILDQRIGAAYKITDSVSVGAEKEIRQDDETGTSSDSYKTDDKVTLKFKKEF